MENKEIEKIQPFPVLCDEDVVKASHVLKGVNALIKQIKESYDPLIKKAKEAHNAVIAERDKHLEGLEKVKQELNKNIIAFNNQKMLEEKSKAEENKKKAEVIDDYFGAISATVQAPIETPKGMYFKDNWKARIVDEYKVPREFLTVDIQKLGQYARMNKEKSKVDGVEFYNDRTAIQRI